jgi:hypothetical protein
MTHNQIDNNISIDKIIYKYTLMSDLIKDSLVIKRWDFFFDWLLQSLSDLGLP